MEGRGTINAIKKFFKLSPIFSLDLLMIIELLHYIYNTHILLFRDRWYCHFIFSIMENLFFFIKNLFVNLFFLI